MSNNDPLHGVTLKKMLEELHQAIGWDGLSTRININCFKSNPSIKSSLTFLRRTPWAREKLENLYLNHIGASTRINPKKSSANIQTNSIDPWSKAKRQLNK